MRTLCCLVLLLGAACGTGCRDAGASPDQPLAFPHQSHTENDIACGFCHEYVDSQATAGMPPTELCGSCHSAMAQDSEATQALMTYVEDEAPIPWVRLYQLPAYSYFPHKWHVRAEISCDTCHGDIGRSLRAAREGELEMAWCIDCHEQRQATTDCVACHK